MKFFKNCLVVIVTLLLFFATAAIAQPANPNEVDDVPVPITGVEWLLAAGGIFGGYKLLKNGRKQKD